MRPNQWPQFSLKCGNLVKIEHSLPLRTYFICRLNLPPKTANVRAAWADHNNNSCWIAILIQMSLKFSIVISNIWPKNWVPRPHLHMVWHQACSIWLMLDPNGSWRLSHEGRIYLRMVRLLVNCLKSLCIGDADWLL